MSLKNVTQPVIRCRNRRNAQILTRTGLSAVREGFSRSIARNRNEYGLFWINSKDASHLAPSDTCGRLRLFAAVFDFCQRDVTHNVTRDKSTARATLEISFMKAGLAHLFLNVAEGRGFGRRVSNPVGENATAVVPPPGGWVFSAIRNMTPKPV
jgi:hypothetical protein